MRTLLRGVGIVLLFLGKTVLNVGHVVLSSIYQSLLAVSKQLQDELRYLRQKHDDLEF